MTSEQLDVARVPKEHIPHIVYTDMVKYVRVRKKDMKLKVPVKLIEMLVAAWGYRDAGRMEELIRNFRTPEEKKMDALRKEEIEDIEGKPKDSSVLRNIGAAFSLNPMN